MEPLHYVLLYAVFFQIVDSIGYGRIGSKLWSWYNGTVRHSEVQQFRKLQRDTIAVQTELGQTSAQDEFAKWAKLRRKLDKMKQDCENQAKKEGTTRQLFEMKVSWGLRAIFWLLQILMITVYRSKPMFYVPEDWIGPFKYLLALPLAPLGMHSL
ncbi:WRB/Get1 family [Gaertneriomyces semiglobifer]|nr:WRB/Get1 family [Gaertneriomyces semiglobifer]